MEKTKKGERLQLSLIIIGTLSFTAYLISHFINNNFNIYGEALSSAAILRIFEGQVFSSKISEIPLHLTNYSPYFYWLTKPVILMLGSRTSLTQLFIWVRLLIFSYYLGSCFLIYRLFKIVATDKFSKKSIALGLLWVSLIIGNLVIAIKVDSISFFMEIMGLYFFALAIQQPKIETKKVIISAFFCALGMGLKLNTLGVAAAIFISLSYWRNWRQAFAFLFVMFATLSLLAAIAYILTGDILTQNIIPCTLAFSRKLNTELYYFFWNLNSFFIQIAFFVFWMLIGLKKLMDRKDRMGLILGLSLLFTFLMGLVGQLRIGSAYNYFADFLMISTITIALALQDVFYRAQINLANKIMIPTVFLLMCTTCLLSTVQNILGRASNQPWKEITRYIDLRYPQGYVYTNNANLAIYLHKRMALQAGVETNVDIFCRGTEKSLPTIHQALSQTRFVSAVIVGENCENWKPNGTFKQHLNHLTHYQHKIGSFCVFD